MSFRVWYVGCLVSFVTFFQRHGTGDMVIDSAWLCSVDCSVCDRKCGGNYLMSWVFVDFVNCPENVDIALSINRHHGLN